MQEAQSRERVVKAFEHVAAAGFLSRDAWCLNRSFCFDVKPAAPKQAVLSSDDLTTARFQMVLRMPALVRLELRGDMTVGGGIWLPDQLKCLKLRTFSGQITNWPALVEMVLLEKVTLETEGAPSMQSGTPLHQLTKLALCCSTALDAILLPLSPQLRILHLDTDFAGDGALQLPPLLEELAVWSGVTKPFALPLPAGLCQVRMHAQDDCDVTASASWRKELVENLPAGVGELVLKEALTLSGWQHRDDQPSEIAWPLTVHSLVLEWWEVMIPLPESITALSITDVDCYLIRDMEHILGQLPVLKSLYITGWDNAGDEDGDEPDTWAEARLPTTIRKLMLGGYVLGILRSGELPPELEDFRVEPDSDFNAPLTQLPSSLRVLHLNKTFDAPLDDIPDGLQEAVLPEGMRLLVQNGTLRLPPTAHVSYI